MSTTSKTVLSSDSRFHFVSTHHTTIRVCESETVNVSANGQFDGGSRDVFEVHVFGTMPYDRQIPTLPAATFPQTYQTAPTAPGVAIVCHSTFQGKSTPPTVYLHPEDFARMTSCNEHEDCRACPELAAACTRSTIPDTRTRKILDTFGYKAGPYRQEEQRRIGVTSSEIDNLVAQGFLKRAANGALAITPKGKVAQQLDILGILAITE